MDYLINHAQKLANHGSTPIAQPIEGRIAYIVSHGQSYASNGYAIRTQGIAKALNQHGFEALCFVRPGRPWELKGYKAKIDPEINLEGVRYIHTQWLTSVLPEGDIANLNANVEYFLKLFRVYRPSAVLAGSNWEVGLPAWVAAKRLGLTFFNEVRGFWELSKAAREPHYERDAKYLAEAERDAFVAQQAHTVFTLNWLMKAEIAKRGTNVNRIEVVPNGVSALPEIRPINNELKQELRIAKNEKVIGYIGSFSAYEGLDVLLGACAELVKNGEKLKLLLVGDNQSLTLKSESIASVTSKTESDQPWLIEVGRVPHERVADYYKLLDAVVIPRKSLPVCEIVPPMKAAEALVYGKRLIVSDVAPLNEYAQKYEGVLSFETGSAASLARVIQRSLTLPTPKPNTELLFSRHIEPLAKALKGAGCAIAFDSISEKVTSASSTSMSLQKIKKSFELKDTVEWLEIEVTQRQFVTIKGGVHYCGKENASDKKAVMILEAYDKNNKRLEVECGVLRKSKKLGGYYKYLSCSQGRVSILHGFEVAEGVEKIKIGFKLFHASGVKVLIDGLDVDIKEKNTSLMQKSPLSTSRAFADISKLLSGNVIPPKLSRRKNNKEYNVLTIMDEFTQDCFKDEFNLIPANRISWRQQLDDFSLDMFFVESAWRGNNATWNYCMSKIKGKFGWPLLELLLECKRRRIPTVFWNKEDPVNYDVFIDAASCFDYIFTTDASVIDRYKKDVGHDRVYLLKFAAQEKLHAPILKGEKNGRVAFAGSWNGKKYPARADRLEMLFAHPLEKGILDIYDRYSSLENAAPGLVYPEKYKNNLLPAVPYNEIADQVYKKYSVMINVNSVENSSSMLARRIYELCGCGTPIVSSPANSLKNELSSIVQIANNGQEARQKISKILEDDIHALRLSAKGVRFVHRSNTYRHRFSEILDKVAGGRKTEETDHFRVTAICVSKRPWFAPNVARMLKMQRGVDVKVIYVAHGEETKEEEVNEAFCGFESFKFMRITGEDMVLADGLNLALDNCETNIVAKIDDDDHYGPYYLLDSCLALQYSGAALVGKTSFFCYVESTDDFALRFPGKHYRYFKRVQGGTLVWNQVMTDGLKFSRVRQGTDSLFIKELLEGGRKVYSSDPFNFVHVRYSSGNNHTWDIDDKKFLEAANKIGKGLLLDVAFN